MLKKFFQNLANQQEISIVILILLVLSMLIIPLPHELMDFLIAFNIGITIVVLMVVVYMDTPLKLTSFPSILLILAMFRIGITISTSRLILLDANAGKIVSTFGEFVIGGNLVVGMIIFIIITIVNFIVITKGSERVAEVAARFSLDAMPGKQMSIDSDLRAGNIDMNEAQRRRNALGLESKLYGAMDGAMKFVKGDSIASIIDIIINLVGGLIIGIVQHNMTAGESLHTYALLTVGDGLVQQIPSLLVSLTAGMMITKVSDDDSKEQLNMGKNILAQVFNDPKALFAAAVLLLLMSAVPGMPTLVFLFLFVAMLIIAFVVMRKSKSSSSGFNTKNAIVEEEKADDLEVPENFTSWKLAPLLLHIAPNLKNSAYNANIRHALSNVQRDILLDLGVEIPQITLRYSNLLNDNQYQMLVYEIPETMGVIYPNNILLIEQNQDFVNSLEISSSIKNNVNFGYSNLGQWIPSVLQKECDDNKIAYLTIEQFISLHLTKVIKSHVAEFLGIQEVKVLLDRMTDYQDLIRELLRMLPLNKITEILQRLVAEDISIRNFKIILDAMLEWSQRERETTIIVEYVRKSLGRYIAHKFTKGMYVLPTIFISQEIEDSIRDAIRVSENGSYLSLDIEIHNKIIEKIKYIFDSSPKSSVPIAVVTQLDIRRYLRSIIEKELNYINVFSFQEIEEYVEFSGLGVVELD